MDTTALSKQLEELLKDFKLLAGRAEHKDLSDLPKNERQALVTRGVAALRRISGDTSTYAKDADRIIKHSPELYAHTTAVMGVVQALYDDVKAGYLKTLVELVHADLFADFLDMAQHLSEAKFKDAAAVIAGSALESHLHALCSKVGIAIELTKADGSVSPKKADLLNSELAAAAVYGKLDQKSVTAWLDLRNKAAHGKYNEYDAPQVSLLISGVREFIGRHPA